LSVFFAAMLLAIPGSASLAQPPAAPVQEKPVLREPFTLHLRLTNGQHYEERFTRRIPYVYNDAAYIFAGESFGLKARIAHGEIAGISYRKHSAGADVELQFRQFVTKSGLPIMMLMIRNNLDKKLYMTAEITTPGDSNRYQTDIRPIAPGQADYETWARPIIELKLSQLRFNPQRSY
jgi:hypothetical protein